MLKAKGTILVDGKEYQPGQTVNGLSDADVKWMKEKGFIEEVQDKPEKPQKKGDKARDDLSGDAKNGS